MKTLTEFPAFNLKNAAKAKQDLVAAGKTPEELPAALGETLKVEGDKLTHLMNALETAGEKFNDLKRVVVFSLVEGEKAPQGAQQKGEHYYSAEYYPPLEPKGGKPARGGEKGERGRRGGKGGKGGRPDKKRGDRGGRGGERGAGPKPAPKV